MNPTDDRVRLLLELTRLLPETLTVQGQEAAYARAALDRLPRTSRGLDRSPWTAKKWLEPVARVDRAIQAYEKANTPGPSRLHQHPVP